jgi:broad specificity phosphatase PhoE
VVLVSHGDPLRIVIADFLGMKLASYRRLQVGNGSISILRFGHQRRQLVALNWLPAGPPAA